MIRCARFPFDGLGAFSLSKRLPPPAASLSLRLQYLVKNLVKLLANLLLLAEQLAEKIIAHPRIRIRDVALAGGSHRTNQVLRCPCAVGGNQRFSRCGFVELLQRPADRGILEVRSIDAPGSHQFAEK